MQQLGLSPYCSEYVFTPPNVTEKIGPCPRSVKRARSPASQARLPEAWSGNRFTIALARPRTCRCTRASPSVSSCFGRGHHERPSGPAGGRLHAPAQCRGRTVAAGRPALGWRRHNSMRRRRQPATSDGVDAELRGPGDHRVPDAGEAPVAGSEPTMPGRRQSPRRRRGAAGQNSGQPAPARRGRTAEPGPQGRGYERGVARGRTAATMPAGY